MKNYNSTLQINNTDLQAILNTINELPEAGSGEQATPKISVDSNGLITATAGTKSATRQLAFQPAKTITPSTTSQIAVSSGYYTGGNIIVTGDSNLVAENIKSGVTIFGITGTYSGGSAAIITFYIATGYMYSEVTEYQAEEGMTWEEWIASDYNVDGFIIGEDERYSYWGTTIFESQSALEAEESSRLCLRNDTAITIYPSDIVIAGETYTFSNKDF